MTNSLSLYFHIPFCLKKCNYCAFYSLPCQEDEVKEAYCNALLRQISFLKTDKEIQTVYFGGGTPPLLGVHRLCRLLSAVKSQFTLARDCEITLEVNPATVDLSALQLLRSAGFNRLSVGIQSADDKVLNFLGRAHSFAQARQCIADGRKASFENISADIIFALPDMTVDSLRYSIENIMSTNVDHISAYSLQLEEGTPLYKSRDTLNFPEEDSEEEQYHLLCDMLTEGGYRHYEVSSYGRDGFQSRHNLNYWRRGEYFGFGAGAHSFYNGKRFSAPDDITHFIEKSAISLLAPTDFYTAPDLSPDEAEEERIMLGLRTSYGAEIPQKAHSIAEKIANLGYGTFQKGVLALNSRGFRVSNQIIAQLLF